MNEVKELMGLVDCKIKVLEVSEEIIDNKKVKVVTMIGKVSRVKCPIYLKYTSSIHDKLKPMKIKYLKEHSGYECKLYNRICPDYGEPDSNIV